MGKPRLSIRVCVAFEGSCEPFHISPDETVGAIKQRIKDHFHVQLSNNEQVQVYLELKYAGATLQDNWCLVDIGITTGSTIRCQVKEVSKAILHVFSAITKETHSIMGQVALLSSSVSKLKSLVSLQLGIPVSVFKLATASGLHLYDCNLLTDYALEAGDTIRLETWDGWNEFLKACFRGHKYTVQRHLCEEKPVLRFQKRAALYMAAACGHLDMASWLIESGVKAEEPVGVHPYRTWCYEMDHPESLKCPTHAAVEAGQLLIIKLFVSSSVINLGSCDPIGRNPLQIAIQHRHRECVSYLVSKLYATVNVPGCSLPMKIYVQTKIWIHKAQRRPCGLRRQRLFKSKVGDTVLVDGFPILKMSSNPKGGISRGCIEVKDSSCGFPVTSSFVGSSWLSHHPAVPPSQNASVKLPQLHPPQTLKNIKREKNLTRNRASERKNPQEILAVENSKGTTQAWRSKVPLPHSFPDICPRRLFINTSPKSTEILSTPLEIFKRLHGRALRENGIYCLAIASTFTEKPWLQQLALAEKLAKQCVQNIEMEWKLHHYPDLTTLPKQP